MTPRHVNRVRAGVTLIELLVVMAIITALGLLALMLLPGISNSDAALKGTEEVRAQVKIAQALAGAARQPRGVRFLTGNTNTDSLLPNSATVATELQLIESPPVTAIDPLALSVRTTPSDQQAGQQRITNAPYVELVYELLPQPTSGSTTPPGQVPGGILTRRCRIVNLDAAQRAQVEPGALLYLPTLGAWSRIANKIGGMHADGTAPFDANEVELDVYPDAAMGASTYYRTYHAGIYGVPVPLLGVPTIPLPKNIGVDLEVSSPTLQSLQANKTVAPTVPPGVPYDLLFAPDGQTLLIGRDYKNTGVYLWVRDITKVVNPGAANPYSMLRGNYTPALPAGSATFYDAFRRGGEHHAVAINNGAVGVAPINWPDASGLYPTGTDPFLLARKKTN